MKTAPQAQHPAIETAPLHRSHLIVDGNSHRTDLCRHPLPEGKQAALISEALLPQIRTTATPSRGNRAASIKPLLMANEPTAADKLPQLPLQSTNAESIDT